jgi:hypothetical protein
MKIIGFALVFDRCDTEPDECTEQTSAKHAQSCMPRYIPTLHSGDAVNVVRATDVDHGLGIVRRRQ